MRARSSADTGGTAIPPALLRPHPQIVLRDSAHDPASPSLNVLEGGVALDRDRRDREAGRDPGRDALGRLHEHVVADALASRTVVRLQVPEFEIEVMELFAMRRRDRAHGVVAQALWAELKRNGAASAKARR